MYPVLVVVALPPCWGIPWLPLEGDTDPPCWVQTKYLSPLATICDWQLGYSRVHHTVEALCSCSARTFSPILWHRHTYPATSTAPAPFVMLLLFHGVRSVHVQLPLFFCSAACSWTDLLADHWYRASGRVLHLKRGISWLPTENAAFHLEFFLPATLGSPEIYLSPSISLCIPPPVLTRQILRRPSLICFVPVVVQSIFPDKLASIVSSRSPSSLGSGSPSPHSCGAMPSRPPFCLPGTSFTSKSKSCIHTIQQVTSSSGRSLVGKFSWYTNVLALVSTRDLTPYT